MLWAANALSAPSRSAVARAFDDAGLWLTFYNRRPNMKSMRAQQVFDAAQRQDREMLTLYGEASDTMASAAAILFMADRLHFHRPDGTRQPANSGAPPILAAFGIDDAERLRSSDIPGALVPNNWTWRPHEHPTLLEECWRDGRGVREHGEA